MSGKSKCPGLQTTSTSDIAQQATSSQFIHSSNTSTRTRQIVTSAPLEPLESITTPLVFEELDTSSFEYLQVTGEDDPPAGVELWTKA